MLLKERQNALAQAKLLNLLLAELESESNNEGEDSYEPMEKRMSYRYGKRMSYRYGKRSAMPYRFGKRAQAYDEYLNENGLNADKRMSYRYGRSVDRVQN